MITIPASLLRLSALVGALALLFPHSPSLRAEEAPPVSPPTPQVRLTAAVAKPVLPAGQKHLTHLKVGLTGFERAMEKKRAPLNLALVLDRSSSMSGEKIVQAREAAQLAVRSLRDDDIISLVTFDSVIDVPIPATRATDRERLCAQIAAIEPRGYTALFAGVSKGAAELRKFLSRERVNRVLLLSDGQANNGPATPGELAELGASLIKEGISVTTIGLGLGYNEDLMTRLAAASDGRHAFVEHADHLADIFQDELGAAAAVVAQRVKIDILCDPGIRPVRVLGRDATVAGSTVTLALNQLYSGEEKYVLLEVEVPEGSHGLTRDLARVRVSYDNLATNDRDDLAATTQVRFSDSLAEVEAAVNKDVLVAAVTQIATLNNQEAVKLVDEGKRETAIHNLRLNSAYLDENAKKLGSKELAIYSDLNDQNLDEISEGKLNEARKKMKESAFANQQSQGKDVEKAALRQQAVPRAKTK